MSYTRVLHSDIIRRVAALAVMIAIITVSLSGVDRAYAYDVQTGDATFESPATPQQQAENDDPEANLPFLFAVFFITWAAFFAYVFVMSRRQREMQREIEALKRALSDKEHQEASGQA